MSMNLSNEETKASLWASENSGLTVTLANKAMIGIMTELVKLICSNKLHA